MTLAMSLTEPAQTVSPVPIPATPAIDLPLQGLHLIEASAGTGKTWTLSTLMVRLIVEGKFFTRQIIATTFTRAAAAELKIRIRSRFEQFRSLCHEAVLDYPNTLHRVIGEQDWLAVYLLQKLSLDEIAHAKNRLQLALDGFDELFVGTLDSFCQKLLNEFAFDSGQHEILQITEQEAEICYQVMHDALRQWRSQQAPQLIELLVLTNQFKTVEDYEKSVQTVLNFLSAQLQPIELPVFDWQRFNELQQALAGCDFETLTPFLHADGEFHSRLTSNRAFSNNAQVFASIGSLSHGNLLDYLGQLDKDSAEAKWLQGFLKIDGHFKKAEQSLKEQFLALPACQLLQQIAEAQDYLQNTLSQIQHYLQYHLGQTVRQQLPHILNERGETTFSQQMRLLASALQQDALSDSQGALARHIQHRYPVALVDEFQDTNADQDVVIAHIWRQTPKELKNCLVLVGDPKQAIYGFRGGDMLTYQRAKQHLKTLGGHEHVLSFNQRSIQPLVEAVDRLFGFTLDLGEQVQYQRVQASGLKRDEMVDHAHEQAVNPVPLRLLNLSDAKNEFVQVGWQIIQLLQHSQAGQVYLQKGSTSKQQDVITPNHIAVLCRSNSQLDKVQAVLAKANVPVWRGSRKSVFQSALAEELVAILQVMLAPYHEGRLRRALSSTMLGKTLKDLLQLDKNPDDLAGLQERFFNLGERWHKFGFLAAWQLCTEQFAIWQQLSSQPDAERLVVNLRHLIEIVHQQSEKIQGQHHLLAWLMRQISHPGQREWEMERRLSGEQGVQLMTIHKSKGLEFPIVFVAGLEKRRNSNQSGVIFYEENQQRMLTFSATNATQVEAHAEREAAELRRLIYVALTRASMRLYVVAPMAPPEKAKSTATKAALYHWLPVDRNVWPDRNTLVCEELPACPDFYYQANEIKNQLGARVLPERRIHAWGLTSFSQLSRHQKLLLLEAEASAMPAADTLLHQDESNSLELLTIDSTDEAPIQPLCFRFPKGTNAGDCLHQILEQLNPAYPQSWDKLFDKQLQNFAIHSQLERYQQAAIQPDEMRQWVEQILQAQLPDGTRLANLSTKVPEFEFHLSVAEAEIPVAQIHQLMLDYAVPVAPLNMVRYARYLHGFIDLVYEHAGRFYIADYKSNFLGDTYAHYQPQTLQHNMSESGYWLQAVLYQVALHRYLKTRLSAYQPAQHLGGAVYLYLRGMQAGSNQTGILHWQADLDLIEQIDQLLGQHACW